MRAFLDCYGKTAFMVAVGLIACSLTLAATPGAGIVFNYFTRSAYVSDSIHQGANFPGWHLQVELEGATDVVQQDAALGPGGFSGCLKPSVEMTPSSRLCLGGKRKSDHAACTGFPSSGH
jgi:hypothetical protein